MCSFWFPQAILIPMLLIDQEGLFCWDWFSEYFLVGSGVILKKVVMLMTVNLIHLTV
jgi:hypothetical protein